MMLVSWAVIRKIISPPGAVLYCHKNLFYIYTKNIERVYKIKKTSCSSLLTITELIEDTAILTEFSIQLDR